MRIEIRKRAMNLLARREHAPAELTFKLNKRGYDPEDVAAVTDRLVADGLLSEARYAQAMIRARSSRGVGPLRIRAELSRMQLSDDLIENTLATADIDWLELASTVRRKRFGAQQPADYKGRARQMRFLQQRGFDHDCIRAVVGENPD